MHVFHAIEDVRQHLSSSAVAIGNFDGCHLGHMALLKRMMEDSKTQQVTPVVLTFYPHPVEVLNPTKKLERLTTAREKLALLEKFGVALVLVERFDTTLANLSPRVFYLKYLRDGLKAKSIHVGFNFEFGKGRAGNTRVLGDLCTEFGAHLTVTEPFQLQQSKVSSSLIRNLIARGDTLAAARFLGRPYSISGEVVHGDSRGGGLGFPTANLHFPAEKVVPKSGVYVTRAVWQKQLFLSVANVGVRPTFVEKAHTLTIEVHLIDFDVRLYEEPLKVFFLERIRDEMKFDSVDSLRTQIEKDVEAAKNSASFNEFRTD